MNQRSFDSLIWPAWLFWFMVISSCVYSQTSQNLPSSNIVKDVLMGDTCWLESSEDCGFNGWELSVADAGQWLSGSGNNYFPIQPNVQHFIVSAGNDPLIGSELQQVHLAGGDCSFRLGNLTPEGKVSVIRKTLNVQTENSILIWRYAAVFLSSTEHDHSGSPFLTISVTDMNGNKYICAEATENQWSEHANVDSNMTYIPWQIKLVDLSPFVGQTVVIEVAAGDCSEGLHAGYAYFDIECAPLSIQKFEDTACVGSPVVLMVPEGALSYNWSNGETSSEIQTVNSGNYHVTITTSAQHPYCYYELSTNLTTKSDTSKLSVIVNEYQICKDVQFSIRPPVHLEDTGYATHGVGEFYKWYKKNKNTGQYDLVAKGKDKYFYDTKRSGRYYYRVFNSACGTSKASPSVYIKPTDCSQNLVLEEEFYDVYEDEKAIEASEFLETIANTEETMTTPIGLSVCPNPVTYVLTINSTFDLSGTNLQLMDVTGKIVLQTSNLSGNTNQIDMSEVAGGVYQYRVSLGSGETAGTGRVVKTRFER